MRAEKRPDVLTPWGDTPIYKVIAWYLSNAFSGRTILVAEYLVCYRLPSQRENYIFS